MTSSSVIYRNNFLLILATSLFLSHLGISLKIVVIIFCQLCIQSEILQFKSFLSFQFNTNKSRKCHISSDFNLFYLSELKEYELQCNLQITKP
jgi:hypothetical protein